MVKISHYHSGETIFEVELLSDDNKLKAGKKLGKAVRLAIMDGIDLDGADLRGVDLWGADLGGISLRNVNLDKANLYNADLRGAKLCGSFMKHTNLRTANLSNVDLSHVDMRSAYLTFANLTGANLFDTNLDGTDLIGTAGIIMLCLPPPCTYNWYAVFREGKIWIKAGCRWQTIDDRERQVQMMYEGTPLAVRLNTISYIRSQVGVLGWEQKV